MEKHEWFGHRLTEKRNLVRTEMDSLRQDIIKSLPETGIGRDAAEKNLGNMTYGLYTAVSTSRYYGFVTGGITPAAESAEKIVSHWDQNVAVHLPQETLATEIENQALRMLCDLLKLEADQFSHRTFTTGATASNFVGVACGREHIISKAAERAGVTDFSSVGELGLHDAMQNAGLNRIQILTTVPHSSFRKAASMAGLGRASIVDVGQTKAPHRFDMEKLESCLKRDKTASIVAISCSEVNTGFFATENFAEMEHVRKLSDAHGAWIHVDGAFGIFARTLTDRSKYGAIMDGCAGMEFADSITGDAHKLLNVPYDCGFFFSRHLSTGTAVFQNTGAAYLATDSTSIPSPLNIGIENSRRFRALPVYATLIAYGRYGYEDMLHRQIVVARAIADFILDHDAYELLPKRLDGVGRDDILQDVFIIVLFRAKDDNLNERLKEKINATGKIYVSPTVWDGQPACRIAVAHWRAHVDKDFDEVKEVLHAVATGQPWGQST